MIVDLVDKLVDRLIQLLTYKKQKRTELLEKHVTPLFEEFERVHSAYLESFSRYRDQIIKAQNANWIRPLQAALRKENLFSANTRSRLRRMAQAGFYDINDPFVTSVCDYVTNVRLVNSIGPNGDPQRWRHSFLEALDGIAVEDWGHAISAFSLSKKAIALETRKICALYPFPRKVDKEDATKRAFALYSLDSIVLDMQRQYDRVCSSYTRLRKALSS